MNDIPVLLLAGGGGTRIRHLLNDLPKPMYPVQGKPFLEHQLDFLKKCGFRKFILSTGYQGEKIRSYFAARKEIEFVNEEKPLGTGGAILNAIRTFGMSHFFCINGDSLFLLNFSEFHAYCLSKNMMTTLALKKEDSGNSRFGSVQCDDTGRVYRFDEKKPSTGGHLINGGVYLINAQQIQSLGFPEVCSVEKDIFPKLASGELYGWITEAPFIDIGTPESLVQAEQFVIENKLNR